MPDQEMSQKKNNLRRSQPGFNQGCFNDPVSALLDVQLHNQRTFTPFPLLEREDLLLSQGTFRHVYGQFEIIVELLDLQLVTAPHTTGMHGQNGKGSIQARVNRLFPGRSQQLSTGFAINYGLAIGNNLVVRLETLNQAVDCLILDLYLIPNDLAGLFKRSFHYLQPPRLFSGLRNSDIQALRLFSIIQPKIEPRSSRSHCGYHYEANKGLRAIHVLQSLLSDRVKDIPNVRNKSCRPRADVNDEFGFLLFFFRKALSLTIDQSRITLIDSLLQLKKRRHNPRRNTTIKILAANGDL